MTGWKTPPPVPLSRRLLPPGLGHGKPVPAAASALKSAARCPQQRAEDSGPYPAQVPQPSGSA